MAKTGAGVHSSRYDGRVIVGKPVPTGHAVVFFRVRKDNCGRERVFRFLKTFSEKDGKAAEACYRATVAGFKVLLRRDEVVREEGEFVLMSTWARTRAGVNIGANPLLAADYGDRELGVRARYFE